MIRDPELRECGSGRAEGSGYIVEDDTALARLLCDNLIYEGFEVALAGDGTRALKEHETFHPDLVLLDLTLPGLDGLEVCRKLVREPARRVRRADSGSAAGVGGHRVPSTHAHRGADGLR